MSDVVTQQRHDATIVRLAADLGTLLANSDRTVLTRVRCQLLSDFPTCLTRFDVAVVDGHPKWLADANGAVLDASTPPRVAINLVTADSLEYDLISTPNTLARTGVSEYVLFDPTGDVLRPSFQTFWKAPGELNRSWLGLKGVFFSGAGFRLDLRGGELVVSECRRARVEEELFVLRYERDALGVTGLEARIAQLERRAQEPRHANGEQG